MKIKVIYRKNLKMSEGKVAAQVAHAVKTLGTTPRDCDIIVLKVSDKKFFEMVEEFSPYVQHDKGLTELEPNTPTAAAWILDEKISIIESYSREDMIESAKYGYEYHATSSFPNTSFEDNCKNNFLQHLWAKNRNKNDKI